MLVKCPECELQVSDKALSCPHCGFPLPSDTAKTGKLKRKANKRRRLPNGFGQISEIKNQNLRKPFRAMVSVGKDENGRPICKPLKPEAYFKTYNDAYAALIEYNKNPYDLGPSITMNELFGKWYEAHGQYRKRSSKYKYLWSYCSKVHNMRVNEIRARHIKECMDTGTAIVHGKLQTPNAYVKKDLKTLFSLMLDYAVEYELTDKNCARSFKLDEETAREISTVKKQHIPYTDAEMELLWVHVDDTPFIDVILIQCYSGWRPQEMGLIELKNVDLEKRVFSGGMKTKAGINRSVPIHSKILPLVARKYKEAQELGSSYLFNRTNPNAAKPSLELNYRKYITDYLEAVMALGLNPEHRPHDGRKHFVTMAKKYKVDEYAIKYLVGHAIYDITEKTYTQRDFEWLRAEIEKIK